jgi:UDP-N-acetylglucosamine:LPS N-acetylglucosamine transferase
MFILSVMIPFDWTLKTCDILCKFSIDQINVIEKNFSDKDLIFVTDSKVIQSSLDSLGYNIIDLDFSMDSGYYSTESINFSKNHIQCIEEFSKKFPEFEYLGVNLADSQKFHAFRELRILQWAQTVLNKYDKIVFLFQSYSWIYFSIIELSKILEFTSKFGVAEIHDEKITSLEFNEKYLSRYKSLSDYVDANPSNKKANFHLFSEEFIDDIVNKMNHPVNLFFLSTNQYDIYTRSLWPIINKLQMFNEKFLVIPYTQKTADKIIEKGFMNFEIFDKLNKLSIGEIPLFEAKLVLDFLNKIKNMHWENPLLHSYSKYMLDNKKTKQFLLTMLKIHFFNSLFKKLNLKSIVISSSSTPDFDLICRIAKNNNIPTFQIPITHSKFHPHHSFFFCASTICVSGTKIKQSLLDQGIAKNQIKVIGDPLYDNVLQLKKKKNQLETKNKNKLIVVAMSRWKNLDFEWISKLISFCNEKSYDILVRPHPSYNISSDWKDYNDDQVKKISKICQELNYKISSEGEFRDIIPQTTLIITDGGSIGVEATLSGIPLIISTLGRKGLEWSSGQNFIDEKVALYANNIEELFDIIEKIMTDKNTQDLLNQSREKFENNFNYLNDGNACNRFIQIILNK